MKLTTSKSLIALTLLTATAGAAIAQQSQRDMTTQANTTTEHILSGINQSQAKQAAAWGITNEEMARYDELTSQGGIYSQLGKDLTVLEVLGMEARSEAERQKYARLMVEQEIRYQQNVLAFEVAKMDVMKEKYPNMEIWYTKEELRQKSLPDLLKGLASYQDKRLVIYVGDECDSDCQDYITKVRSSASSSTRVDIFFTNTRGDDKKLRDAVSKLGLNPKDIDGTTLTVNHDKGYFARLKVDGVKTLPMAVRLDKTGEVVPVQGW